MKFTAENFKSGFLVDGELMAGIAETPDSPGTFTAFVVRHSTGETLGAQEFTNLFEAIRTINDIPREWEFESTAGGCGGGTCDGNGGCGKKDGAKKEGGCGKHKH